MKILSLFVTLSLSVRSFVVSDRVLGRESAQDGVRGLLPRGTTEESRSEDLRRVRRRCSSVLRCSSGEFRFRANIYPCPENPFERRELAMGVLTRLEDLNVVLHQTQDHRQRVLAATSRNLRTWQIKVKKIKAIYHTMNMFNHDVARKCLIAECWAPVSELDRIQLALRKGSVRSLCLEQEREESVELSAGGQWRWNGVLGVESNDHSGTTSHASQVEQIHPRFPESGRRVRRGHVPRDQSDALRLDHFPLSLRGDVRRRGSRVDRHSLRPVDGSSGTFVEGQMAKSRSVDDLLRGKIHHSPHGSLLHLHWTDLQRRLLQVSERLRIFLASDIRVKNSERGGKECQAKDRDIFRDETLKKVDSVILEPTPFNYSNPDYRQMYSGTPYPFGLDPVRCSSREGEKRREERRENLDLASGREQDHLHQFDQDEIRDHHRYRSNGIRRRSQSLESFVRSIFSERGMRSSSSRHFNHRYAIYLEFLPQLIFLACIFFYLIILIFYKWTHFDGTQASTAPSLLIRTFTLSLSLSRLR